MDAIGYETDGQIALVTLNRPAAHNALTPAMLVELDHAFAEFTADPSLRVAILTGAGDRSFCAGGDLRETIPRLLDGDTSIVSRDPRTRFLSRCHKPVIAAVNGNCIAGGTELMLGTDLRVASEHAVFGLAEVTWGVLPAGGSTVRLPRQIPYAVAMEIMLTGEPLTASRAYEIGLVNRVVPHPELLDEAFRLATRVASNGPVAVTAVKEIVMRNADLEPDFEVEFRVSAPVFASDDAREGVRAFTERRAPRFSGT
jgi:enoyl-CoA hydratase